MPEATAGRGASAGGCGSRPSLGNQGLARSVLLPLGGQGLSLACFGVCRTHPVPLGDKHCQAVTKVGTALRICKTPEKAPNVCSLRSSPATKSRRRKTSRAQQKASRRTSESKKPPRRTPVEEKGGWGGPRAVPPKSPPLGTGSRAGRKVQAVETPPVTSPGQHPEQGKASPVPMPRAVWAPGALHSPPSRPPPPSPCASTQGRGVTSAS